jgi:hypothetical protein
MGAGPEQAASNSIAIHPARIAPPRAPCAPLAAAGRREAEEHKHRGPDRSLDPARGSDRSTLRHPLV